MGVKVFFGFMANIVGVWRLFEESSKVIVKVRVLEKNLHDRVIKKFQ